MTYWEIDVELRVRKTLAVAGPLTAATVRETIESALRPGKRRGIVIDNDPQIVAIRRVEED